MKYIKWTTPDGSTLEIFFSPMNDERERQKIRAKAAGLPNLRQFGRFSSYMRDSLLSVMENAGFSTWSDFTDSLDMGVLFELNAFIESGDVKELVKYLPT